MNVKTFKNLIKEAVSEAVREELSAIMLEPPKKAITPLRESKAVSFTTNDVHEVVDVRTQLRAKMGNAFGFNSPTPQVNSITNTPLTVDTTDSNPYMSFIIDAAHNMTAQDKAGLNNLG